jgi:ethanolamine utilization protein EutA
MSADVEKPGTDSDEITSVGIDIGTTTTHLVISKLRFSNSSLQNRAPHLSICHRRIIFQSEIFATPLDHAGEIDEEATTALIAGAYAKAGISPEQITTGALIVTGQSAAKANAFSASSKLADFAGDFVVECAGPHLESFLAARGSSAVEYSRNSGKTILNIDIGGGTSNYALVAAGKVVSTACLAMGGKFISIDRSSGTISKLSDSAVALFKHRPDLALAVGDDITCATARLTQLTRVMAEEILLVANGGARYSELMLTDPLEICADQFDIWLSGGVAALMDQGNGINKNSDTTCYDDIGAELAQSLTALLSAGERSWRTAPQAIRATVIGAGMHSVQLSGSTIGFEEACLPLRNLRLVPLYFSADSFENTFRKELQNRQIDWQETPLAIVIGGLDKQNLSFKFLKELAESIATLFLDEKGKEPLVIVSDIDLAMGLKQLLSAKLKGSSIITIDGIDASEGDYIDIGKPVISSTDQNTRSLSVVVKTLVFYKSAV